MSLSYTFSDAEIKELEAVRPIFNRFTGSRLNIHQFVALIITEAIKANLESAIAAQTINRPKEKLTLVGGDYVH